MARHDAEVHRAQQLVGGTRLYDVPQIRRRVERDFRRQARAAWKVKVTRPGKRKKRSERAFGAFAAAIFWATLERDYADEIQSREIGKVLDVEGAEQVLMRWDEAWTRAGVVAQRSSPADTSRLVETAAHPQLLKGDAR